MQEGLKFAVTWWPIGRVVPYHSNPRKIPETAVAQVAASIERFGWQQPIVVDEDGVILAGHTRRLAAERLGLGRVPVHVAKGLSEAERRAYRLADNRVAEATTWDVSILKLEIDGLAGIDFDLAPIGLGLDFAAGLDGADPPAPPGAAPLPSNYAEQYGVIVICRDEDDQRRVYDDLRGRGLDVKVVTT